jgi:hypothetical protein
MRNLIVGLILLLGVLFIISNFTQLEAIVEIAQQGDWRYFGLAILVEITGLVAVGADISYIFRALGYKRGILRLVRVAVAANFVSIVAPSGGMSGLAVLVTDARRNRISTAHGTVAGAVFLLLDYIGFAFFLVLGLVVLARRGGLNATELFAAGLLWLLAGLLALILYLGSRSEEALAKWLRRIIRKINLILKLFRLDKVLEEEKAGNFAHKIADGLIQMRKKPQMLLPAAAASFVHKSMMLVVFWLMFLAFRVPFSPGTLFAGFALAYLFLIVSPTPAGIGIVEGIVTLSLVSMFVPIGSAAVVVLGYRAVTFWFPLFLGMLAMQSLSGKASAKKVKS